MYVGLFKIVFFLLAYVGDEEGLKLRVIAGGIVIIVVVAVAIIVLLVVFIRSRANDECNKKQPSDCDTLEYRNGEGELKFFNNAIYLGFIFAIENVIYV